MKENNNNQAHPPKEGVFITVSCFFGFFKKPFSKTFAIPVVSEMIRNHMSKREKVVIASEHRREFLRTMYNLLHKEVIVSPRGDSRSWLATMIHEHFALLNDRDPQKLLSRKSVENELYDVVDVEQSDPARRP